MKLTVNTMHIGKQWLPAVPLEYSESMETIS